MSPPIAPCCGMCLRCICMCFHGNRIPCSMVPSWCTCTVHVDHTPALGGCVCAVGGGAAMRGVSVVRGGVCAVSTQSWSACVSSHNTHLKHYLFKLAMLSRSVVCCLLSLGMVVVRQGCMYLPWLFWPQSTKGSGLRLQCIRLQT